MQLNYLLHRFIFALLFTVDAPDFCTAHQGEIIENPDNCAMYFNCSKQGSDLNMECTYPELFDTSTKMCIRFEQVDCQSRPEPMAPCKFNTKAIKKVSTCTVGCN